MLKLNNVNKFTVFDILVFITVSPKFPNYGSSANLLHLSNSILKGIAHADLAKKNIFGINIYCFSNLGMIFL